MLKQFGAFAISLSLILTLLPNTILAETNVDDALSALDTMYDGERLLDWKVKLFDPETGGFYYALSAVKNRGFGPDIESTVSNALPYYKAPSSLKQKCGSWIQGLQDEGDGWFYDTQYGKAVQESKKSRDYAYAIQLLNNCGLSPLYPTPDERVSTTNAGKAFGPLVLELKEYAGEDFLSSKEACLNWVATNFDWTTSSGMWSAGNTLDGYFDIFRKLGYLKDVMEFIASKQNPETGMWGDEVSYNAISGAAKFSVKGFGSDSNTIPFPNYDKLIDNVMTILRQQTPTGGLSHVWNVVVALYEGRRSYNNTLDNETEQKLQQLLPEIIQITTTNLQRFKKDDGGFSYSMTSGQAISQGVVRSLGLNESDANGTALALNIRTELYYLAKGYVPAGVYSDDEFINRCMAKAPITKPYVDDYRYRFTIADRHFERDGKVLNTISAGDITAKATISGGSDDITLYAFLGGYSAGKLIALSLKQYDIADEAVEITDTIAVDSTIDTVKCLIVDDALKPYASFKLDANTYDASITDMYVDASHHAYIQPDKKRILLPINESASLDSIAPIITTSIGASVEPKSGASVNMTSRISYQLLNEAGISETWTIVPITTNTFDFEDDTVISSSSTIYDSPLINGKVLNEVTSTSDNSTRLGTPYKPGDSGYWYKNTVEGTQTFDQTASLSLKTENNNSYINLTKSSLTQYARVLRNTYVPKLTLPVGVFEYRFRVNGNGMTLINSSMFAQVFIKCTRSTFKIGARYYGSSDETYYTQSFTRGKWYTITCIAEKVDYSNLTGTAIADVYITDEDGNRTLIASVDCSACSNGGRFSDKSRFGEGNYQFNFALCAPTQNTTNIDIDDISIGYEKN